MKEQRVLIIAGMHRSGTSLVTSMMQAAGVHIGERLLGAYQGNVRGHFEDLDFLEFHKKVLHRCGIPSSFTDSTPALTPDPEEEKEASSLVAGRRGHRAWGWKDPRTSLFLDFWHQLLPQARFLFIYRHPLEVLLSLARRGTDFEAVASPAFCLRTWIVYNQCILDFYSQHRDLCVLGHISGIVEKTDRFMDLVSGRFELALQTAGVGSLFRASELRHNAEASSPAATAVLGKIVPSAVSLYDELEREADMPSGTSDQGLAQPSPYLAEILRLVSGSDMNDERRAAVASPLIALLLAALDPETIKGLEREAQKLALRTANLDRQYQKQIADMNAGSAQAAQNYEAEIEKLMAGNAQAVQAYEAEIAKMRRIIEESEATIRARSGEMEELRSTWAQEQSEWRRRTAELAQEAAGLRNELTALCDSRTWRLRTAAVRWWQRLSGVFHRSPGA